jgi:tRNA-dihydrouridine synthase
VALFWVGSGSREREDHQGAITAIKLGDRSVLFFFFAQMLPDLSYIAAPMVDQSDLPFRVLVQKYGATLCYSQMLNPQKLLNDREYLEYHQRDLQYGAEALVDSKTRQRPVIVQLSGNDPDVVVAAGRKMEGLCDGIGESTKPLA